MSRRQAVSSSPNAAMRSITGMRASGLGIYRKTVRNSAG
jgi:hypothetical protein